MIDQLTKLYGIETAYGISNLKQLKYTKPKDNLEIVTIVTIGWGNTCLIMKELEGNFSCKSFEVENIIKNTYKEILLALIPFVSIMDTVVSVNLINKWMVEMFLTEDFGNKHPQELSDIEELRFIMALNNTKVIFHYEDVNPNFIKKAVEHLTNTGFPMLKTPRTRLSSLVKCLPDNAFTIKDYRCLPIETKTSLQNFLKNYMKQQEIKASSLKI